MAVELGDRRSVSRADETDKTEEIGGQGEEREIGGGGTEERGSAMTTKRGKPGRGDAAARVGESEGGEKNEESSWKVTSAEVI